ncbi:hypothetical protein Agub_g9416, partial [Astrephomene gubernaculifera]
MASFGYRISVSGTSVRPELSEAFADVWSALFVTCLAEHVWRQQSSRKPSCPICRQPMLHCAPWDASTRGEGAATAAPSSRKESTACEPPVEPAAAKAAPTTVSQQGPGAAACSSPFPSHTQGILLQLQVGRVRFELPSDPHQGSIRDTLCKLYKLHPSRVKLVHRGRALEGEEELRRAAEARAVVALLASRGSAVEAGGGGRWL